MSGGVPLLPLYTVMAVAGTTVTLTERDKITCSLFYNCDTTQLGLELLALQTGGKETTGET